MAEEYSFELARALCEKFIERYPDSEYGAGHITLGDQNFEPEHILFCLLEVQNRRHDIIEKRKVLAHEECELNALFSFLNNLMIVGVADEDKTNE